MSGIEDWDSFKAVRGRGVQQLIVHSRECDEPLLIASDKARDTFLKKIVETYCEGMGIESYYCLHHAMEKDD